MRWKSAVRKEDIDMPKRPGVNGCPIQCAGLISALWCIVFPSTGGASWKALLNSYIKTCAYIFYFN